MKLGNPESVGAKVWWRHWSVVFILAVLAAFAIWALIKAGPWLRGWQERSAANALRKQAEEQLRNDKYGGKTPEETFDMFIAALEKGDVELASKYFVIQKQENWLKTLQAYEDKKILPDFIFELKNNRKNWQRIDSVDSKMATFKYKVLVSSDTIADLNGQKVDIPAGNYTNNSNFEFYPSGVWKIGIL